MPKVSIKALNLPKAAGSTGSYTPQKLKNFFQKERTSDPYSGSITYKRLMEKPTMDKKKFINGKKTICLKKY